MSTDRCLAYVRANQATAHVAQHWFAVGTVERQAQHVADGIVSAIANRYAHPSYGYTKTDIRNDLWRLRGILDALCTLRGIYARDQVAAELGIDLDLLREAVDLT